MACLPITDSKSVGAPYYSGGGGGGAVSSFATASISSLTVSSINGAAPGAGGFFSTLSVPLPTQTSTVLMTLPPGTWSYNGLAIYAGNTEPLNGFANTLSNTTTGFNYGSLYTNSNSQPSGGIVPVEMTLNFGDSPLSTVKLICANNSVSLAGTWVGSVFKLN